MSGHVNEQRTTPVFNLGALPDELLELVVAACLPGAADPWALRSDRLKPTLALALSCKRIMGMMGAQWKIHLLQGLPSRDGLRLTASQVRKAPVEQLREWAAKAGIDRDTPRKPRYGKQERPTVERLRQIIAAQCVSSLPQWQRRLFPGEGPPNRRGRSSRPNGPCSLHASPCSARA